MRRIYLLPHADKIIHVETIADLRVGDGGSVHGGEFICKCIPVPFYVPPSRDKFQKEERTVPILSKTQESRCTDCSSYGNLCETDCLRLKV